MGYFIFWQKRLNQSGWSNIANRLPLFWTLWLSIPTKRSPLLTLAIRQTGNLCVKVHQRQPDAKKLGYSSPSPECCCARALKLFSVGFSFRFSPICISEVNYCARHLFHLLPNFNSIMQQILFVSALPQTCSRHLVVLSNLLSELTSPPNG